MNSNRSLLATLIGLAVSALATPSHAQLAAGVDFQQGTSTVEPGFTGVTAGGGKTYSATQNGITMDFVGTSTGGNANRDRAGAIDAFPLLDDFLQLVGTNVDGGRPSAAITFSGLAPNTAYLFTIHSHNQGAFQQNHTFFHGTTSGTNLGTFITTFNPSATSPDPSLAAIPFQLTSDSSGTVLITMLANADRVTINGFSVTTIAAPPPPVFNLAITANASPGLYDFAWNSREGMVYDLLTSSDLATPTAGWPVYNDGVTLHQAIPSAGETTTLTAVPSSAPRRFFAVREYVAPPPPVAPELASVWGSGTTITLSFTGTMQESSATDPGNYTVQLEGGGSVTVTGASLSGDGRTVTLTLGSALGINSAYTVNMANLAGSNGAPLGGSTVAPFQTWDNDPNGIKVFILAGQSNMVGYGHSETGNGGLAGAIGSLRHLAVNDASYPDYEYASLLVNPADPANSAWKTRSDVKAWWKDGGTGLGGTVRKGDLGPPFLGIDADQYGPEYAFGQVLGDHYASEDVLIIKAAWGGKSLAVDFRPPSAVARAPGTQVGPFYRGIFDNVRAALANLGTDFPEWAGRGYQIVGFGWHQGWNDRVDQTSNDEYELNMKDFIDDVRTELGQPALPFVIATTGMTGPTETHPRALSLMNAQLAMENFTKYEDHEGNVEVIDTRNFWRDAAVSPVNQGFHWNQNGETYFLIGKSMGDGMVGLLEP
jgi:alpha-galactosidase